MDPLSALRDYTTRGDLDRVVLTNDEIHFGSEYTFPASSPTAFRSKQGSFYPLHALLFFLRNQHLKHADYVQSTILHRVPGVTLPDRKPLLDYLHSLVPSSDSVHHLPPLPLPQPQPSSPPTPVPAQPDVDAVAMVKALERPLKDREALLECKGRDFYAVLVASTKREEERARTEGQQRKDGLVAKSRLLGSDEPKLHLKAGKVGDGVPIILVPSASQTLITIYNVREFLEDGVYVPVDVKVKEMRGVPKPDCITVQKKLSRDRVVAAYEVRDKPSALKKDDWERVVAVFVLGKEWQFKDWPFKDHVEIFNKIIGFYVRFEDDSVESAKIVKQWNVKIISISKNKRHQDRAAALEVWDRLEAFMRSRSHT